MLFCSSKTFPGRYSTETCLPWAFILASSPKPNALSLDVQHSLIRRQGLWGTFTRTSKWLSELRAGTRQTGIQMVWSHSWTYRHLLSTFLIRTCTSRIHKYMLTYLNEAVFLSRYLAVGPPVFVIICQIKSSSRLGIPEVFLELQHSHVQQECFHVISYPYLPFTGLENIQSCWKRAPFSSPREELPSLWRCSATIPHPAGRSSTSNCNSTVVQITLCTIHGSTTRSLTLRQSWRYGVASTHPAVRGTQHQRVASTRLLLTYSK